MPRKPRLLGSLTLLALVAAGCGKPTSAPLFQSVPQLDQVPEFQPLAMREIPQAVRDQLVLRLEPGTGMPDGEAFVNSPGAEARADGGRPTVVISVPLEATRAARQAADLRAQGYVPQSSVAPENVSAAALESFQTDGYYNEAEQQIEAALIRRGFDVLDRARFEATLRDLRDQAEDRRRCFWSWCDLFEARGLEAAIEDLEEQLEDGEITREEFQEQVSEAERRADRTSPGERRTEDEMVDIAEVIRAAQSGNEQSDYLLQISLVQVEPSFDREFVIDRFPETQAFLRRHPGLQIGRAAGQLPPSVPARWYRAEFNAKLMSVRTGSIVWLGNHTLTSADAEPLTITMDVERRVANAEAVTQAIRDYNLRGDRLRDDALRTRATLESLYQQAQVPQAFESDQALLQWEQKTRDDVAQLERRFRDLREELAAHAAARPPEFTEDFEYAYTVSEPRVDPNLTDFDASDRRAQELLDEHRNALIQAVTRSLIATIEVIG